jgi:hypothetical protein
MGTEIEHIFEIPRFLGTEDQPNGEPLENRENDNA